MVRSISKTRMLDLVKTFQTDAVAKGLQEKPELIEFRDASGRNYLHLCASVDVRKKSRSEASNSVSLAGVLLNAGIGINSPASTRGSWHATPLWYAVGRGRNMPLARFLLEEGSSPDHCLWAAVFHDDLEMLELLVSAGASLDATPEYEPPLMLAVMGKKFACAEFLLAAGSDPNYQHAHGMTAPHQMLKRNCDVEHFGMFVEYGARGDIANEDGKTAAELLYRKRDRAFHRIADQLK